MRRTTRPAVVLCVAAVLAVARAAASPAQDVYRGAVPTPGKFQAALQQQNFFSVLTSIEERLRSLDNIYTMQLSQTLETKLDQYSRRLEALDTKMIRLEALVMFNLDKISENISTKNFKDDMTKTTMLKKMDTIYEGISHRLGYIERKYDTNMAKIQTKVDTTLTRFERIEENMMARDSDIEAEISDVIFAIDDLKTTCTAMEEKLYNISSATLNITKNSHKSLQDMYQESSKSLNALHNSIIGTLENMNNGTSKHVKILEENNVILKTMRSELKDDFNNYANKVADMSSYSWKNSDTIENSLKLLEVITNNTKTEVQNGVRSLMVQIGKISNKENVIPSGDSALDEINKNLKTNFQRILTNQDLFLESCHRVQMDESQIETEISVTLENLIDMLEKKMASELKDIKNFERALKSHDNRVGRNMYQINSNVISLFEKSTINTETLNREIRKIENNLDALFAFVQSTITSGPLSINFKVFQEKINRIEGMISKISHSRIQPNLDNSNFTEEVYGNINEQVQNFSRSLTLIEIYLKNTLSEDNLEKIMHNSLQNNLYNCNVTNDTKTVKTDESKIDNKTRTIIEDIFGTNTQLTKSNNTLLKNDDISKRKCKQNTDFTETRSDIPKNCEVIQEKSSKRKKKLQKSKKKKPFLSLIDLRGSFDPEENIEYEEPEENFENSTLDNLDLITEEASIMETTTIISEDMYNITETKQNNTSNE